MKNEVALAGYEALLRNIKNEKCVLRFIRTPSAAFVLGSHPVFTMAYDSSYVLPVMLGKLTSGLCAVILAAIAYKEPKPKTA